jgi:beta-N-acetylhexosaminidase
MTLAERSGELLLFGFEGTTERDIPLDLVARASGVILFRRNIQDARQLRALTDAIRQLGSFEHGPPLIAIDQEGGSVSRLAQVGTTTPSAMALGAVRDPLAAQSMYRIIGDELSALGCSVDFAPVADLNSNPRNPVIGLRSFGDDPDAVGLYVRAAIRGLHGAGVAATAKHFPGHGDTTVDSHFGLPSIAHDLSRVRSVELAPFAAAIREHVDLIMSAHAVFPAIEPDKPATLSRDVLTGLLREELGFEGVIVTDCLEMDAIAAQHAPEEAAVAAVAAGADLVLFSHTPDKARAACHALRDAITDGRIPAPAVSRSLARIEQLRRRMAAGAPALENVGSAAHQEAALAVARRAVTVIRDPKEMLPLRLGKAERMLVVEFAGARASGVEDGAATPRASLAPWLRASGARIHEQIRSLDPAGHEYKQLLMASGTAAAVVVLLSRASQHPLQARAVADLAMLGKRMVAIAGREPYDASMLPPELTVIASFGEDPHAMQAAAEVILGRISAQGTLPVTVAPAQPAAT